MRIDPPGDPEAATVRWGLIGCGWLARDYTAPAIHAAANARLVAAFDPRPGAAEACGPLRVAASIEALLDDPDVDAVYIATPNYLHAPQAVAALEAGKHVLCEKPTALNAALAQDIADAAEAAGSAGPERLAATAYDQRFHGAHLALSDLIRRGELGQVTTVRIRYACWTGADWAPPGDDAHDNWRVDPERAGGGAMIDLAPHGLDLFQTLIDDIVDPDNARCLMQRRVHTGVDVDDGAAIIARSRRGVLLDHSVSYNCPEAFPRRELEVVGTLGRAYAHNTMGQTPGGTLTLMDAEGRERAIDFRAADQSPFLNQIVAFSDAVLGSLPWRFPFARDVRTMQVLDRFTAEDALERSAARGEMAS